MLGRGLCQWADLGRCGGSCRTLHKALTRHSPAFLGRAGLADFLQYGAGSGWARRRAGRPARPAHLPTLGVSVLVIFVVAIYIAALMYCLYTTQEKSLDFSSTNV